MARPRKVEATRGDVSIMDTSDDAALELPPFPAGTYPDTEDNRDRWRLSVLAAMKAMSLDDPLTAVVVFYAHVFFKSDVPTRDA